MATGRDEMRVRQRAGYGIKTLLHSVFGQAATDALKTVAGLYFDAFYDCFTTEGMVFNFPREHTRRSLRAKFLFDTYELPERTLAKRYVPSSARVLELGGCIGVVSCTINRMLTDPTAHVVVEANPHLIPFLSDNKKANGAAFAIEHCVVSRKSLALLAVEPNMDSSRVRERGIPIHTRTLEDLEIKCDIKFDTLIMDIEGGEADFITENLRLLQQFNLVMLEFHPNILGKNSIAHLRGLLKASGLSRIDEIRGTEVFKRE